MVAVTTGATLTRVRQRSWVALSIAVLVAAAGVSHSVATPLATHPGKHRQPPFHATAVLRPSEVHDRAAMMTYFAATMARTPRLLVPELTGTASAAASLQLRPHAAAGSMPDVTGDGLDDVFEITYEPRLYSARDGRSGRVLWSIPAPDYFYASYATLGVPARPALLVQTFSGDTPTSGSAGVAAIDAATGKVMWTYARQSVSVDGVLAYEQAGVLLAGSSPRPHAADAVLVEIASVLFGAVVSSGASTPMTIDGATGAAGSPGLPMISDDIPRVFALPDLDGDGVADYALASNGTAAQLSVRSGSDGSSLWATAAVTTDGFGSWVEPLANATGIGKPGVVVINDHSDSGTITAYEGSTGRQLWQVDALDAQDIGDANHDRVPELLLFDFVGNGFGFRSVSGATGAQRWKSHVDELPIEGSGGGSLGYGPGGDLNGDAVQDGLVERSRSGRHPLEDQVVLDGATGRQRVFRNLFGAPLGAPLLGARDAVIDVDPTAAALTIKARELGRSVWSRTFAIKDSSGLAFLDHGHFRDRHNDVIVTTYGKQGTDIFALKGANGATLWRVHV